MSKRIPVISPNGKLGSIPEDQLDAAIQHGGYSLAEEPTSFDSPEEIVDFVEVISPTGKKGRIPRANLEAALQNNYTLYEEPQTDSWPALIGKSALKGITSLADLPQFAGSIIGGSTNPEYGLLGQLRKGANLLRGEEHVPLKGVNDYLPEIPMTSSLINQGIEGATGWNPTPHPSTGGQRIAANAAEWLLPGGILGKAPKAMNLLSNMGKAAAIGGTSGAIQEAGVNPLVADITASAFQPTPANIKGAFNKAKELPLKVPMKIMGLTPGRLNIEAGQAARDLGVDLPAAALTDSKLTALADQVIGKTPYFGNKLGHKYINTENQMRKVLENIYDEIGPLDSPEVNAEIKRLYDLSIGENALPPEIRTKPRNLDKALANVDTNTALPSDDELKLFNSVNKLKKEIRPEASFLVEDGFRPRFNKADNTYNIDSQAGTLNLPLQDFEVKRLVNTKRSLNDQINWNKEEGVKNRLKNIQRGVSDDIAEYGAENPEWYDAFKKADDLHGKKMKRKNVEEYLGGSVNPSTGDLGFAALSKRIHNPKKQKFLEKNVPPETYEKIQKLGTLSKALAIKNRSVPNPSGTAPVSAVLGFMASMYRPEALAGVIGTAATTKLLTDKKFLDLALKYAENPNKASLTLPLALSNRIQDVTKISPIIISRELQRAQENELQ